ncbi:HNH endonuclease [Shewanella xiamenensis]|uniref:HNH endonuclease n=1 Tax=Shewanella xiamenensis TaxID=332186 RepID=UPI0035BADDC4
MNTELWFTLVSLKKTISFSLAGKPDEIDIYILELFHAFGAEIDFERFKITITSLSENTELLRNRVYIYVSKYCTHSPAINKLNDFFRLLDDNEKFYFLPGIKKLTQKQAMETCLELLYHVNGDIDFNYNRGKFSETFDYFLDKYSIEGKISDKKIRIGEGLKSKRVCRFCNNTRDEITRFSQEAHAISESLGNKTIILNEECDACNKYFSETIERDIDTYHKIWATFFKVKNKDNKVPKIKGKNFELFQNSTSSGPDHVLMYKPSEDDEGCDKSTPPKNIPLEFNAKVRMQNIYKALVKFSLSVIDSDDINRFIKTISWISSDLYYKKLPKVALLKSYHGFSKGAELKVYLRKDDDVRLPSAVGEFQFTFLKYVFIIPTFDNNECDFTEDDNYEFFWSFFKFYHYEKHWEYQCFSNSEAKDFVFNIILDLKPGNNQNQSDT